MRLLKAGVYQILCRKQNKYYWKIEGNSVSANAIVKLGGQQYGDDGGYMMFHVFPLDVGVYLIANYKSGFTIGIPGNSTEQREDLKQLKLDGNTESSSITWRIFHQVSEFFEIVNQKSGLYATTDSWESLDNTTVQQEVRASKKHEENQMWEFRVITKHIYKPDETTSDVDIGDINRFTSWDRPEPQQTKEVFIGSVKIPFPFINDPGMNTTQQSENSPYYTITRYGYWDQVYFKDHSGASESKQKETVTVGLSSTNSEQVEKTTGISVTAGASFSYGGFSASISATVSRDLKVSTSSSATTESSSTVEVERVYPKGPRSAETVWYRSDRYEVKRQDGKQVLEWTVRDPNVMINDSYSQ